MHERRWDRRSELSGTVGPSYLKRSDLEQNAHDRPRRREAAGGHCLAGCTPGAVSIKLSVCERRLTGYKLRLDLAAALFTEPMRLKTG